MLIIDNEFVEEHKPLIYKLLGESGRNYSREEMQRLFVDTVIKLLINARFYRDKHSIGTFIGLQVRSVIADFTGTEAGGKDALGFVVTDEVPEESDEVPDTPLEILQEKVAPFLPLLDGVEREVFTDRVINGLPIAEVADRRGLHSKSVSRIMKRAMTNLTRLLKSSGGLSYKYYGDTDQPLRHVIKSMFNDRDYFIFKFILLDGMTPYQVHLLSGQSPEDIRQRAIYLQKNLGRYLDERPCNPNVATDEETFSQPEPGDY